MGKEEGKRMEARKGVQAMTWELKRSRKRRNGGRKRGMAGEEEVGEEGKGDE